ncbi:MAG: permease [Clostridia bacterium]|nr:permease [Clostridia bacterium]
MNNQTEPSTPVEPSVNENKPKKSLKWLWITIALAVVAGLAAWCICSAIFNPKSGIEGAANVLNFNSTFVLFVIVFLVLAVGYLIGGIDIKGVSLGTAGVFLIAILVGYLCTLVPENAGIFSGFHLTEKSSVVNTLKTTVQNIGLIMFVGSVGFIAGPNFFKNLAKNFKTYIVMGVVIILSGTLVAVICTLLTEYGPEYWSGVLSGALTSTPGFSAAKDAVAGAVNESDLESLITLGHAIAYPFGVVGVVLFVQLLPRFLKADMPKERELLKLGASEEARDYSKFFKCEDFGFMPFGLAIIAGLLLGSITIPLTGEGYNGPCFSLGTTGGVLIMCLVFGHFGHIGKLSLEVKEGTLKVMRELGLALFLLGAGVHGGVSLVEQVSQYGAGIVVWGFVGGALMTIVPMIVGFILGKWVLKLPLLNSLGSITGGMTSTPALGTLISTAGTDDVASAYASTYPIALILVVLASQLLITLM